MKTNDALNRSRRKFLLAAGAAATGLAVGGWMTAAQVRQILGVKS